MKQPPENSVHPKTRAEWRQWLSRNHERTQGIWLITWRRATGRPRLEYDEVVEEALCFGWIDSTANTLDEERSMLWMAPRKPKTGWAKTNKERVARLIAEGRMEAPGLAKIEAAKADGSWSSLDAIEAMEIPRDLAAAFRRNAGAKKHFEAFPPSVKKGILAWIHQAKKPETRAARVAETARLAARNERVNQWKKS